MSTVLVLADQMVDSPGELLAVSTDRSKLIAFASQWAAQHGLTVDVQLLEQPDDPAEIDGFHGFRQLVIEEVPVI